jgi:hypothetical protein
MTRARRSDAAPLKIRTQTFLAWLRNPHFVGAISCVKGTLVGITAFFGTTSGSLSPCCQCISRV